jgi:hypothetical protein
MLTTSADPIVIRRAYPDDAPALARLAQLDAKRLPADSYLVAEVDGELKAPLVRLLHLHADGVRRREEKIKRVERRLRSLLPTGRNLRHAPAHR